MTDADLATIDQRIQSAGAANCWTGTLGSLAADARRLVRFIQETRKMAEEYPPRIEVPCNTCRGIVGLVPMCPDCMGHGKVWKINSPSEPWKYRDEDPACFRPGFDKDKYERKAAATRAAAAAISVQAEYPVDHILRGERELRHFTGDEAAPEEAMILTEEDAADVAHETGKAAQIGNGRAFPEPETAGPPVDQSTPGKWVNKGQAPGELPGWDRYEFVPEVAGPPVAVRLLEQATAAVKDRHAVYGPPTAHFARTVGMVNSLFRDVLRRPLTTSDWARIMLLDKLARDLGPKPHPDNAVDIAGYAACLAECNASAPPAAGGG